jgi:hypothetical protein
MDRGCYGLNLSGGSSPSPTVYSTPIVDSCFMLTTRTAPVLFNRHCAWTSHGDAMIWWSGFRRSYDCLHLRVSGPIPSSLGTNYAGPAGSGRGEYEYDGDLNVRCCPRVG